MPRLIQTPSPLHAVPASPQAKAELQNTSRIFHSLKSLLSSLHLSSRKEKMTRQCANQATCALHCLHMCFVYQHCCQTQWPLPNWWENQLHHCSRRTTLLPLSVHPTGVWEDYIFCIAFKPYGITNPHLRSVAHVFPAPASGSRKWKAKRTCANQVRYLGVPSGPPYPSGYRID